MMLARLLLLGAGLAHAGALALGPRARYGATATASRADRDFYPFEHTLVAAPQPLSTPHSSIAWLALPITLALCGAAGSAVADSATQEALFNPATFQPVCPASDGVYQVLKVTANSLLGGEKADEYGPLIASVLLRVRLEICVLESFLYEAIIPFIAKRGLSWVLPLHETVETFLTGTIFAIASNFILLGSTKILSILFLYFDVITGMPARFLGDTLKKVNPTQSVLSAVGSAMKVYGDVVGTLKNILERTDSFVGRYLVVITTIYITFKFMHFKVFNDVIPF